MTGDPDHNPDSCPMCTIGLDPSVVELEPARWVLDDVQADDTGLRVTGHFDPAEPDWSDPDVGPCYTWHDQVPPDSHCAICLWAPRDDGAFAQTTDPCVCQRGMRHSCGIRVGGVPERGTATAEVAADTEAEPWGRWSRWLDRNGTTVLYWLCGLCFSALVNTLRLGWWTPACWVVAAVTYAVVRLWADPKPNPVGMPGWEIRRDRTLRLPRLSIWQQPPLTVGLWWWRHSLDGGPWSPWWPALTHPRALAAVGRWLPFPIPTAPAMVEATIPLADIDTGHYRRSDLTTPAELEAARQTMTDQASLLTVDQALGRAAAALARARIPLAGLHLPPIPDDLDGWFEGVTIHGPATDDDVPRSVNLSVDAANPGTQGPEHSWDSAQIMHTDVLDQPCYRCGAGRVLLSDLTGLCEPCKKELTA